MHTPSGAAAVWRVYTQFDTRQRCVRVSTSFYTSQPGHNSSSAHTLNTAALVLQARARIKQQRAMKRHTQPSTAPGSEVQLNVRHTLLRRDHESARPPARAQTSAVSCRVQCVTRATQNKYGQTTKQTDERAVVGSKHEADGTRTHSRHEKREPTHLGADRAQAPGRVPTAAHRADERCDQRREQRHAKTRNGHTTQAKTASVGNKESRVLRENSTYAPCCGRQGD
jgi:hypothetical protein